MTTHSAVAQSESVQNTTPVRSTTSIQMTSSRDAFRPFLGRCYTQIFLLMHHVFSAYRRRSGLRFPASSVCESALEAPPEVSTMVAWGSPLRFESRQDASHGNDEQGALDGRETRNRTCADDNCQATKQTHQRYEGERLMKAWAQEKMTSTGEGVLACHDTERSECMTIPRLA